jgi:hypothetical protein
MKLFICNVIGPYQTGEIPKKQKQFSANSSGQQLSERERIRKKRHSPRDPRFSVKEKEG